jgi:hypothetical protein
VRLRSSRLLTFRIVTRRPQAFAIFATAERRRWAVDCSRILRCQVGDLLRLVATLEMVPLAGFVPSSRGWIGRRPNQNRTMTIWIWNAYLALLRKLSPRQEKVIRLFFGLGCQRSHSAQEVAQAFGVSVQAVTGLLGAAQRRLAQAGLTSSQLRQAAREEADLRPPSGPVQEARCTERRHTGSHRRC